jgi:Bacterial Ig-like domain (group 2)
LVSIAIAPPNPSIPKGETQQLVATGSYNDGSTQDITGQVSWSNTAPNIVGLSGSDPVNITAENIGAATLTATAGSISGSTRVTVSAPVAVALSVVPANTSVAVGLTQQLSAVETFSDGTTQRLTNALAWISENPDIATVDNSGLVTGQAEGLATIAASYLLLNGSATLTVTPFNYFLTESRATSNRYSYFANANVSGIDSTFRITNPGVTGQDLCAMVYVFAADQQMSECCGCRVTTNGLLTLSLNNDLNLNPLTGKVPASGTVEVVAADPSSNPTCDPSTLTPLGELTVWSTHIQNLAPDSSGDNGGGGGAGESTRTPVDPQSECAFVQSLGSGQGICTCGTEQ